jgi:hypothetical protein
MSMIASQLISLRKQHQSALASYDFQRAGLIYEQIQSLQQQASNDARRSERTHAERQFKYDSDVITTNTRESDRLFADQSADITDHFAARKKAVEQFFQQEADRLRAQHAMAVERETSRAIPEVDALFLESRVHGKHHNYTQARIVHEQAIKLRNFVNDDRRRATDAIFLRNARTLGERKAKALAQIDQAEKAAIARIDRKRDYAAALLSQRMRVSELKVDRLRRESVRSQRSGRSLSSLSLTRSTPRRSQSVASNSPFTRRSWQIGLESI